MISLRHARPAACCLVHAGGWSGDKCTGGMISCTSLRCSCYNHHNNAGDTETLVTAVSSAPQHAAPGEIILNCLITAQWEIAEGDVIEQLGGKVLSSQFQFNHKMPLPKWRFFASKASIKVLESIRTRLAHDTTLHSEATPLLSMVS